MRFDKIICDVNEGKREEGPGLNTGNPPTFRMWEEGKDLVNEVEQEWPTKQRENQEYGCPAKYRNQSVIRINVIFIN